MKIYHNPRCSKSRQTLSIIEESDREVEIVKYLETPPTAKELKEIIDKLGIKAEDLVRKTESVFKEKFKDKELNEQEWIEAMVEFPKLIQRPIVIEGGKAIIGRPPESVEKLL